MKTDAKTEYIYLIRNIRNAAQCIVEYADNHGEKDPDAITWADVGSMSKVYNDLLEIACFCNITVKEV